VAIVVDSNLLIVMVNGDPRGGQVQMLFTQWIEQDIDIHAPDLAPYEVANSLTRSIVANAFPQDNLITALNFISRLPITYHPFLQGSRARLSRQILGRQLFMVAQREKVDSVINCWYS